MVHLILMALLTATAVLPGADTHGARVIQLPATEHGYQGFTSQVIADPGAWAAFVAQVEAQDAWNDRAGFLAAIAARAPDYTRERLVLVRHTEGSGSNGVAFTIEGMKGDTLTCHIARTIPEVGTTDMAYHCFALAVDPARIRRVEVCRDGVAAPEVISVGAP